MEHVSMLAHDWNSAKAGRRQLQPLVRRRACRYLRRGSFRCLHRLLHRSFTPPKSIEPHEECEAEKIGAHAEAIQAEKEIDTINAPTKLGMVDSDDGTQEETENGERIKLETVISKRGIATPQTAPHRERGSRSLKK
jgi:hypothetical protein